MLQSWICQVFAIFGQNIQILCKYHEKLENIFSIHILLNLVSILHSESSSHSLQYNLWNQSEYINLMICYFWQNVIFQQDVFVKHRCPRRQQSQTMTKIYNFYILTPTHPQGHVISVKWEQPLYELTVQVW